jgi:large subunit ribosomal protein L6
MSRLIKKPIKIVSGVTVAQAAGIIIFKGPKGEDKVKLPHGVNVAVKGEDILVESTDKERGTADAGTVWALIKNAIEGVTAGFVKVLEIEGVGYRAVMEGKDLMLHLGYALPVRVKVPAGAAIAIEKNILKISGIEKELVGRFAAEIRALKKPEPYKGKGIHYQGEVIRRKVGKKAGATSAAA